MANSSVPSNTIFHRIDVLSIRERLVRRNTLKKTSPTPANPTVPPRWPPIDARNDAASADYSPKTAKLSPNTGMATRQIPRLSLRYMVFHHKIRDSNATRWRTSSNSISRSWLKVK
jgi:hypothetical protein